MTLVETRQRPSVRISAHKARTNLQAAIDNLNAAAWQAEVDEASRRSWDLEQDQKSAALLRKSEAQRNSNTRDADRAWLSTMAEKLRSLSFDAGGADFAVMRIAERTRELAEECERVLRSLG
jgi:hypothetical protein